MLCLRCSHDNPQGLNFCQKCNARLLQIADGNAAPTSMLELDENTNYLPAERYVTEHIYNLTCRAYEYLYAEEPVEPLIEAFNVCRDRLEEFKAEGLPEIVATMQMERQNFPELDVAPQILYQVNHGASLFERGVELFQGFLESGDEGTLVMAVTHMQDGNDHLCLVNDLLKARQPMLEMLVEACQKAPEQ